MNWEPVASEDELWIADLDVAGHRIYAIGTAPAQAGTTPTARTGDLVVASSTDGGATWSNTVLPISPVPGSVVSGVYGAQVVAGPVGVVAAVPTTISHDTAALLPGVDLRWGFQPTETGFLAAVSSYPTPQASGPRLARPFSQLSAWRAVSGPPR